MLEQPSLPAAFLFSLALLMGTVPRAAPAQEVIVGNADTVRVTNGGVWHLQGGVMDFGGVDTTASLVEANKGRVTGGTLTATRALNAPSQADPAGLGAVLSASVDLGAVTITRGHTVQTGNGNSSIKRYYSIEPSKNNSGLSATLTHTYEDAELNNLSESNLELFKSTDGGSTWSEEGADSRNTQANTVTLSGVESFSRWTLGSEASPLPVELTTFKGTRVEQGVRLSWQVASETGNAGFEVQRRAEGASGGASGEAGSGWTKVGFVESRAEGGTTSEPLRYRFTDEDLPYAADTLGYRLRQVDTDGTTQVTKSVTVARSGPERLQLKETYPNPARTRVTVRYAVPEKEAGSEVKLRLYDVLGREVRTAVAGAEAGRHETQMSLQNLASGTYLLHLEAGETAKTRRLTVVR